MLSLLCLQLILRLSLFVCVVITFSRLGINRVWLPILFVDRENGIYSVPVYA